MRRLGEEEQGAARTDSLEFMCILRTEFKVEAASRAGWNDLHSTILCISHSSLL